MTARLRDVFAGEEGLVFDWTERDPDAEWRVPADMTMADLLGDYAAEWSRRSEIPAEVHVRGQREVPLEVEQALFRVAQEALANVARHSGAKSVEVDLVYDPDRLMLRVTDDGRGFDPKKNTGDGFGLQSMSERVATLGGYVDVESAPGKGTRVVCACPLDDSSIEKGRGT